MLTHLTSGVKLILTSDEGAIKGVDGKLGINKHGVSASFGGGGNFAGPVQHLLSRLKKNEKTIRKLLSCLTFFF